MPVIALLVCQLLRYDIHVLRCDFRDFPVFERFKSCEKELFWMNLRETSGVILPYYDGSSNEIREAKALCGRNIPTDFLCLRPNFR